MNAATQFSGSAARAGRRGWLGMRAAPIRWACVAWAAGTLLALTGAGAFAAAADEAAPLYRYEVGEPLKTTDLEALAPLLPEGTVVRRARVLGAETPGPLAELEIAETAAGPVLLDWRARVDDPFLALAPPRDDVAVLAPVLKRHVPADAALLAWWDASRQFRLLAGVPVVFDQHLWVPRFVPSRWSSRAAEVEAIEAGFWLGAKAPDLDAERARFARFTDALVAPAAEGMTALRTLGGGKPLVLVLHLRDVILLGQIAPDRLGVAFQDLGVMGDVHGMARRVRGWMVDNDYAAYSVMQRGDRAVRAVALTDEASAQTLTSLPVPIRMTSGASAWASAMT